MAGRPCPLSPGEIDTLLARDVVLHLATIDEDGFPHITPLRFLWAEDCFLMTSLPTKPHVHRLRRNNRAGVVVDVEAAESPTGERPNRQVRAIGAAHLDVDDGRWTRAITEKYLCGPGRDDMVQQRTTRRRIVIRLRPRSVVAVASI